MESKKLKQTQRYVLRLFMMGSNEHIKRLIPKLRPAEIVELMAHLRKSDQIRFLQLLFDVRMAAPTLTELPAEFAKELICQFADDAIAEMTRRLSPDDAVDLLAYLPEERQEQVAKIKALSAQKAQERLDRAAAAKSGEAAPAKAEVTETTAKSAPVKATPKKAPVKKAPAKTPAAKADAAPKPAAAKKPAAKKPAAKKPAPKKAAPE